MPAPRALPERVLREAATVGPGEVGSRTHVREEHGPVRRVRVGWRWSAVRYCVRPGRQPDPEAEGRVRRGAEGVRCAHNAYGAVHC